MKYRAYVVGNSENAIFFAQEKFLFTSFFSLLLVTATCQRYFGGSQFNNFDECGGQGTVVMGEFNLMQVQFIWRLSVHQPGGFLDIG